MPCRVMFYVQHLLGVGHLKRASCIARAMVRQGLDVAVVTGGPDVPGIGFEGCVRIPLPPVHAADTSFRLLLDEDNQPIDDDWRERRVARLLTEFEAFRPRVLMLEMFPFGRMQFRFELLPLLEAARTRQPRPAIVSSVRDALVDKDDPVRSERMVRLAGKWFDAILVHGDPRLYPLSATFAAAEALADRLSYTGYVAERPDTAARPPAARHDEVVVSVGGGAVGEPLLRTAIAARPLSTLADRTWRLIAGPNLPDALYAALAWNAPAGIIVERWREDLPALLRGAALSISQAGYNTVMDVLQARVPAVLVPFADADETEQTFRARALAERGAVTLLEADQLSPAALAAAADAAVVRTIPPPAIDMQGAETTARLIASLCPQPASRALPT
jgi:predicted glycosyltransferase